MMKRITNILLFVGCSLLIACTKQPPQRPSQRSGQVSQPDPATLAIVELHQRLADAADRELMQYIQKHPGKWFNQEDGSWFTPGSLTNESSSTQLPIGDNDFINLRLVTRDLQGNLFSDVQGEYELGKCQIPPSVENVITSSTKLSSFTILAPWYVAYGSKGNDAVPGYQNVTI